MEAIIIVIFSFILLSCILAGYSILWALLFGYMMFFGYALRQGHCQYLYRQCPDEEYARSKISSSSLSLSV